MHEAQPQVIALRDRPEFKDRAIAYFQKCWPDVLPAIYDDCITHSLSARDNLPQWYLLIMESQFIGCAGLITNDFISRGDLYPWLCALFIDEAYRGHAFGSLLMDKAKAHTKAFGYTHLYLCTSLSDYYEKYGFSYIGNGYHPWGETSKIYEIAV